MPDFKKLLVWRKAHLLAVGIHRAASRVRQPRYTPLRNQMVRAALSIPANIVEGREQRSDREFARFLQYALGSASEVEYRLVGPENERPASSVKLTA